MSKRHPIRDADDLPKEWHDGRLYAIVSEPGTYLYEGTYHTFANPGSLLLFSLLPEDWTTT